MKKLLIALALLVSTTAVAQEKDVTTFLGIPVDGAKSDMIQKLKEKGFVPSSYKDTLEGEFNGTDVYISVVTNNNKVYRIVVSDKNTIGETDIRIRFNNLCYQFENNPRYINISDKEYTIKEDEDISYNIKVNDKRYAASYIQMPSVKTLEEAIVKLGYSKDDCSKEEVKQHLFQEVIKVSYNKQVWFKIDEFRGEYCIVMYYDNALNQANGEDL